MGLFDIFDSIGRDIDRVLREEANRGVEDFARLDERVQRSILDDIRNLSKEGLDENAIRDFLRKKYNIDLPTDFIRRIEADLGLAESDIKGFLKKLGIGLGLAGGGLGLGYLLFHRGRGSRSPLLSPLPQQQTSPSSPVVGGSPSSPYPSSPYPSSPYPLLGGSPSQGFLGLPWWVWLIIAIIIIAIIAYLLYKHHKKKKKSSGEKK
jgi:hypothetical protein